MNSVVLIGRLTKDPELRFLPGNGTAVSTFSIAVDKEVSKEKKQEMESKGQPTADFINIVAWGRRAETCANYLVKGRLVAVQGRIQSRSYDAADGSRRYVTEVVADNVQFLEWGDGKQGNTNREFGSNESNNYIDTDGFRPVDDDDIPF